MSALKFWHRLFLDQRPSIGLSFFRIFAALTTGLHVIPTFFQLGDNYFSTAFKTVNAGFFPMGILELVSKSPDGLVVAFVWLFALSWFCFLIGLWSQASCIVMTVCCYYFYALNSFHIGTLSWDILLVTLFLMCITPYHGDYFSLDALRRNNPDAYKTPRPYFVQRLLQLQIASIFFYTALYKISPQGNWLTGNPLHVLMNYPTAGVTKTFLIKDWLAIHPQLCYWIGIFIVVMELALPFLLFYKKTRRSAIVAGFIFHILLVLTLDVPAIFFFLFPAQLLLFIQPQEIIDWVDLRRQRSHKMKIIYDGGCGFCRKSVDRLKVMDLWGHLTYETGPQDLNEMKLIEEKKTYGGFDAFRRLCFYLPMLYPLLPVVYLPGATPIGRVCYRFIASHRSRSCKL